MEVYPRKLILTPGFDNCLRAYAPKQWDEFDAALRQLNPNDPDEGDFLRFFRAMATPAALDGNDRLRLPDALMNWAGIDEEHREVQVFDTGEYLEFWQVDRWNSFMTEKSTTLKELARRIFGKERQTQEGTADGAGAQAGDGS